MIRSDPRLTEAEKETEVAELLRRMRVPDAEEPDAGPPDTG
ncbi:hypothetical protein ACFYM0_36730 [Streptomyces sp. NPDC006487]